MDNIQHASNDNMTELMLVTLNRLKYLHILPSVIIGNAQVLCKQSAKNFSFSLDFGVTINDKVFATARIYIFVLHHQASIIHH